jgi:molybdopterin synthase catalytic subunit
LGKVTSVAVRVLYFAAAREAAGTPQEELNRAPATVAELRLALVALHPALARILPRCRIAVDEEFASDEANVAEGAEVAVVPPVAGGAPLFAVVDHPLSFDEVVRAVESEALGGLVTFTGTVRSASRGRRVVRLEYEAYRPMAERVLARIGEEVGRAHGAALAVVHRVGVLVPGDLAVVIAAAAAHRAPAFRACEECLERLKHDVPVFKREVFEDGSEWVGLGP